MSGLQSQKSPLRIHKQFYRPYHPKKLSYSRRNFPQIYLTQSPIVDAQQPSSIIKYVGELDRVKHIDRQYCHNDLYYPDPQKNKKKIPNMYATIKTRKNSSGFLKPLQLKSIETQRNCFIKTFRAKSQKKQAMNLSFYNNTSKSKIVMQKFHNDKYLNQRSSPTFQNMLQRTIVIDDILSKVKLNQRKFVKGF